MRHRLPAISLVRLLATVPVLSLLALPTFPPTEASGQLPRGVLVEARTALTEGRADDALAELERLSAEYPDSPFVAVLFGHAWRMKGDRPAATAEYLRALELAPANPDALIALGDMQLAAGNLAQASSYYERAIEVAPRYPLAHRKAAATEVQRARHGSAIVHLEAFLTLRGDDLEALNVLGIEQYLNEDHDGAIATLERALRVDADNAKAHFGLGMVLSDRADENDRALEHLQRAVELDPANPTAYYLLGRVLIAQERLEEALSVLERSLELSPTLADAHYRIALVYARLGDRESARDHQAQFQQLSRAQDDAEARETRLGVLRNAATAALAGNDPSAFRAAVDELLQEDPDDPGVLTLSARGALADGDIERGLTHINRALTISPDQWESLYVLGLLQQESDRPEQARATLQGVVERNPLFASGYAALGKVLVELQDVEAAAEAFRTAARLDPEQPVHYLNLATVYRQLGLTDLEAEALATYQRLVNRQ